MSSTDPLHEVAGRLGVSRAVAEHVDALGLLPREADGSLGPAAAGRLRLLAFARNRGIDDDLLLAAMRSQGDLLAAFDNLVPAPLGDDELRELVSEIGIGTTFVQEMFAAIGTDSGEPLTADDVQALGAAKQALDLGLPQEVLLQLVRVFADNMERLAEAENRIFHDHVHERYRAEGMSGGWLIEATAGMRAGLLSLVEPTVLYFHRRAWGRAAQYDFLRHLTEDSRPLPSAPGASSCAVVFADLSGFTPLTAAMGDSAAAEVLSRFGAAVRKLTTAHDGRVVKQIGDAFMLVFEDRRNAVAGGVALLDWCGREPRFPPVHIGAHAGEVLFREGDFVGAVVNLAARVAATTEPMQFLVTADVLAGLELPDDMVTLPQAPRRLKGIHDAVALTAVSPPTAAPGARASDPVCGMLVDIGDETETRSWDGRLWSFCSARCAAAFVVEPVRYLTSATGAR